ncbi:hypothetical protein E2C01_020340 [Portunus trituberculatus]|uniref:Uncharacterized protein n=1 Tax=Portunus trituberculatus TaxID=210409 RepID=A0A5B7E115_PORTR|nr:hypothetical protein [Portunus trituberculatus]
MRKEVKSPAGALWGGVRHRPQAGPHGTVAIKHKHVFLRGGEQGTAKGSSATGWGVLASLPWPCLTLSEAGMAGTSTPPQQRCGVLAGWLLGLARRSVARLHGRAPPRSKPRA